MKKNLSLTAKNRKIEEKPKPYSEESKNPNSLPFLYPFSEEP